MFLKSYRNYFLKEKQFQNNQTMLKAVGALTSRIGSFTNRPWEMRLSEALDLTDALVSNIYINSKGTSIVRIIPKPNKYSHGNLITDKCRCSQFNFNRNRLEYLYKYSKVERKYNTVSWFSFLYNKELLIPSETVHVLLSPETGLETLLFLKMQSTAYQNKLKVFSVKRNSSYSNTYKFLFDNLNIFHGKMSNCFILSVNPYIELNILNFKLKLKYQKTLFSIFFFCTNYNSISKNNKVGFLSLSMNKMLSFFESKAKKLSKFFLAYSSPLIILGSSFLSRCCSYKNIISFLQVKILTLKLLKLNRFCNEEGINALNIKHNFKATSSSLLFCVDLYDNLSLRKNILLKNSNALWLNPFKPLPCLNFFFRYLIPTLNSLEESSSFLSLENKFQHMQRVFSTLINNRAAIDIFSSLYSFQNNNFFIKSLSLLFFNEIIKNYSFNLRNQLKFNIYQPKNLLMKIGIYPTKAII